MSGATIQECFTWRDELASLRSDVAECLKSKSVFLKWDEVCPLIFV